VSSEFPLLTDPVRHYSIILRQGIYFMGRYILKRLLQAIPLLFIISIIMFILAQSIGDPLATMGGRNPTRPEDRERLRRQLGLNKPLYLQYVYWMAGNDWTKVDLNGDGIEETAGKRKGVLRGDFGTSIMVRGAQVMDLIAERIPNTLILMVPAWIVILLVGISIGIFSALRQYSVLDNVFTAGSFIGLSMPVFFIAMLLVYFFSVLMHRWGLPFLPSMGMFDPGVGKTPQQVAIHMIMPVISIAFVSVASYSRYTRSSMLDVLNQDYIRTARAKGLENRYIILVHALKNAALPIVTILGLDLPLLLAGAVVTERVFGWPGMGRLFLDHLDNSDAPVVMGIVILVAMAVIVFQILTDLAYAALDPRIRLE
jgi:peptide/nickel transport system permease protein